MTTKKKVYRVGVITEVCVTVYVEATSKAEAEAVAEWWREEHEARDLVCGVGVTEMHPDIYADWFIAERLKLGVTADIESLEDMTTNAK